MANLVIPHQDPERLISAPNNPRGLMAARALNQLYKNAKLDFNTPTLITYPATPEDVAIGMYTNSLLCGLQHLGDRTFYHAWPDQSLLVGRVSNGMLTILPVVLRTRNSLSEKLYTPIDRIQHTTYRHLDGIDFWLSFLDKNPTITRTQTSSIPIPWHSLSWITEDAHREMRDIIREGASWLMATTSHHINSAAVTIDYRAQLRNGSLTPLKVQWWQSTNDPRPILDEMAKMTKAITHWLNKNPITKGNALVEQSSHTGKSNPKQLTVKCPWSSTSTHEHMENITRFKEKTGL